MNRTQLKRLIKVRDVMKGVPAARVAMFSLAGFDGCGCAMHHYRKASRRKLPMWTEWPAFFGLDDNVTSEIFASGSGGERAYTTSRGAPAKREFLKRINAVIRKAQKDLVP